MHQTEAKQIIAERFLRNLSTLKLPLAQACLSARPEGSIHGLLSPFPPPCMLPPWSGIRGDSLNLQNCILWSVWRRPGIVCRRLTRGLEGYYYFWYWALIIITIFQYSRHTTSFPNCILNKTFAFAFLIIYFSLCMLLNTFTSKLKRKNHNLSYKNCYVRSANNNTTASIPLIILRKYVGSYFLFRYYPEHVLK